MPHRILVVDDEEMLRNLARIFLERLGYDVVMATGGEEGLALYEQMQGEIQVVLLDLTMPGLSGAKTLSRLQLIDPQVRVLLASGYDEPSELTSGDEPVSFIEKPFTLDSLRDKLNELID